MVDIAFDVALRLQHHALAADRPHDVAAHHDFFRDDPACDACPLADHDVSTVDIALDLAIDLNLSLGG